MEALIFSLLLVIRVRPDSYTESRWWLRIGPCLAPHASACTRRCSYVVQIPSISVRAVLAEQFCDEKKGSAALWRIEFLRTFP